MELKISISDAIAALAFLVAGLSALYARWSWSEAKKANSISLHVHKKEIYDAFFELKMHMTQKARLAEQSQVSKFYYPSKNAKFYFPGNLSEDIERYFQACFHIADINGKYGGITTEGGVESKAHIEVEKELAQRIEAALIKLLQESSLKNPKRCFRAAR